jgi:hypothetical protein
MKLGDRHALNESDITTAGNEFEQSNVIRETESSVYGLKRMKTQLSKAEKSLWKQ